MLIRPDAISAAARSVLIFDQLLPGLRGVNRCSQYSSSWRPFWPSIQPWHSATSSASE